MDEKEREKLVDRYKKLSMIKHFEDHPGKAEEMFLIMEAAVDDEILDNKLSDIEPDIEE